MTVEETALFSPIKVGDVELKHRVVLAPLTRFRADKDNEVTDMQVKHYGERAAHGGSLLITEATMVNPGSSGYDHTPGIWRESQIGGWKKVFDEIHAKGSSAFMQLWHSGRCGNPEVLKKLGCDLVSSSDVPMDADSPTPRPLTKEEIKKLVGEYVHAAKNAIAAGADGVEIHCGNGYLMDQFMHENTNKRTDEYGGSIENRARIVLEVADGIIEAIGAQKLALRFSPWSTFGGMDPGVSPIPQFSYIVSELQRRANEGKQLAYIHMIEPRVINWADIETANTNRFVRDIWSGALIRAGGYNREDMLKDTAEDPKLLVAMGRYYTSNPDLVAKLKDNTPLVKYNRDTFYTPATSVGYID